MVSWMTCTSCCCWVMHKLSSDSLRLVKIGAHPRTLPSLNKLQGSETVGVAASPPM